MKFFSGFCLSNESELFDEFLDHSAFNIAGFSLGAIKAVEYAYNSKSRVDKLQLFSPAFFQDKDKAFKRAQLLYFKKDEQSYIDNFLKNISFPSNIDMNSYYVKDSIINLEKLINHIYQKDIFTTLIKRGIKIEVYLGELDKIIDHKKAKEFFEEFTTIYIIKEKGHILNG